MSIAFAGEVLGYSSSECCSPGGNRRQVVHTINGLYGDLTFVGVGGTFTQSGNTITFTVAGSGIAGNEAIANGASEVQITFPVGSFDVAPIFTASVEKGAPGDPDVAYWTVRSLTANGAVAILSGAVPNENYVLHWKAQEEGGATPVPGVTNAIVDELGNFIVDENGNFLVY